MSQCESGKMEGCVASTENCDMRCMSADLQAAVLRAQADTAGCRAQYDASYSCASTGSACDVTTRCMTQSSAYLSCIAAFCAASPTSPACGG